MNRETGRVVAAGQIVDGVLLDVLLVDPLELLDWHHLALVADGMDRVLICVWRLEQAALQIMELISELSEIYKQRVFVFLLQGEHLRRLGTKVIQ